MICDNIDALRSRYSREADGTNGIDGGSYSFSTYIDHPSGHVVTQLDPCAIRPSRSSIVSPPPAEKYGASTVSVLEEVGYSAEEIKRLLNDGIVSQSWSTEYLPS